MIQIITTITQHGRHIQHITDITAPICDPATDTERKLATAVMHAAFKTLTHHSDIETSNATIVEFDNPQIIEQ